MTPELETNVNTTTLNQPRAARLPALRLLAVGALLLLAAGCHKKTSAINPASLPPGYGSEAASGVAAPTASIAADPLAIELGQTVVLNWRTTNATTVSIDGIGQVNVNGTQTVSPSNSTNFHLVAKGDGGSTEANVRVTVHVPTTPLGGTTTMGDAGGGNGANGGGTSVTDQAFHAAVADIFFDYDSYELRPDAQAAAGQAASFLVQHPDVRVLVGGFCDERGSAEYNVALGENRANSAKTALVNAGIAPARIRVISYGKEKQFCTESEESCFQENRRAQFTIDR